MIRLPADGPWLVDHLYLGASGSERRPAADVVAPYEGRGARIVFAGSGLEAACTEGDTILQIARSVSVGLVIPNPCQFGACGTCKIQRLSGEVRMVHNGGICDDEIEEGYILACCSKPIGRVEVAV